MLCNTKFKTHFKKNLNLLRVLTILNVWYVSGPQSDSRQYLLLNALKEWIFFRQKWVIVMVTCNGYSCLKPQPATEKTWTISCALLVLGNHIIHMDLLCQTCWTFHIWVQATFLSQVGLFHYSNAYLFEKIRALDPSNNRKRCLEIFWCSRMWRRAPSYPEVCHGPVLHPAVQCMKSRSHLDSKIWKNGWRQMTFLTFVCPSCKVSLCSFFIIPSPIYERKLELWMPQTTKKGVLKFLMQQELQAIMLQKDFSSMGTFFFHNLMFSQLSWIIVDIIMSGSSKRWKDDRWRKQDSLCACNLPSTRGQASSEIAQQNDLALPGC